MNYFIYFTSFHSSHGKNGNLQLTLLPMCGFIAQLVEHRTGNAEVTGSNPVEAWIFFRLLISSCINWKIHCDDHFSLTLQCYPTWMRGNFGLKLQNSPKLPHIHARFHCNSNEQSWRWKGLFSHFTQWQRGLERRWIRRKRKDYLLHRALRKEIFLQKSKVMSCNVWTFLSVLKFFIDF